MENSYVHWISGQAELERRREVAERYRLLWILKADRINIGRILLSSAGKILVRYGLQLERWGKTAVPGPSKEYSDRDVLSKASRLVV